MATTLLVVAIALVLPFTWVGRFFGLVALPAPFFLFLSAATAAYLMLVELAKKLFVTKLLAEPAESAAASHPAWLAQVT